MNAQAAIGHNRPPLPGPDELPAFLDQEYAALLSEAALLDAGAAVLPKEPATDDECAAVAGHVVKLKELGKRLESARAETGRPYVEGQRKVNGWFKEVTDPLNLCADGLIKRVGVYNRAKAEREAAERRAREQQERERAEALRREEEENRRLAEEKAREAEAKAQAIRAAPTEAARAEAFQDMMAAERQGDIARERAEEQAEWAAQAERKADTHGRAAEADIGRRSRVGSATATSSVTSAWTAEIVDMAALLASLGPLAPWLPDAAIQDAVARAVREQSHGGHKPSRPIPGVEYRETTRVNIRAAR